MRINACPVLLSALYSNGHINRFVGVTNHATKGRNRLVMLRANTTWQDALMTTEPEKSKNFEKDTPRLKIIRLFIVFCIFVSLPLCVHFSGAPVSWTPIQIANSYWHNYPHSNESKNSKRYLIHSQQ